MAPAIAAVVREQRRRRGAAVPSMPGPAPRAHVARHPRYGSAGLSLEDHRRLVMRVMLGLEFLDGVLRVVLELFRGRVIAHLHLRRMVWRDGDLVVLLLLLLLEMGGPAGVFDLEVGLVRLVGMVLVHLGQLGAAARPWAD